MTIPKQNPTKWLYKTNLFCTMQNNIANKTLDLKNIVQSLTLGLNTKFASKQPKQNVQINLKRVQHLSKSLTRTNNHNISWFPKNNTIRTFTLTTIITSVLCKNTSINKRSNKTANKTMLLINPKSKDLPVLRPPVKTE